MHLTLNTPLPGRAAQIEMAPLYRTPALLKDIPRGAMESAVLALLFPANEGKSREEARAEERKQWEEMTIEDHMEVYTKQGMDKKSAMKAVAKDRGVSKRDIYQYLESRK